MSTPVPNIGRTIRNIRRARQILTVFASFGFTDVIYDLELDRVALKGQRLLGIAEADQEVKRLPTAVRIRKAMESLGPTFVKMAQILSTRPDLVPEEWAEEFADLQSDVEEVPPDEIQPHIAALYDDELDDYFREVTYEAFAAGSIAQAHDATLTDGQRVVLKVLRPGIRDQIDADIEILQRLASFIESHFENIGYSPVKIVDEFARQIRRELDLELEARSIRRMNKAFEENPNICFPTVIQTHTREGVLCMERVEGILLARRQPDDLNADQRRMVVAHGSDAVFRQCFQIGFFHADPHPGNIVATPISDDDVTLCFLDCGMTGHIEPKTAEMLADLVHGTIQGDLDRVIDVVIALTDASPVIATNRAFRADAWEFISRFQTDSLADLDMGALLSEFFAKIRTHQLECPADIVYLIKAVTTIEGVGEAICPEFDLIGHVQPYMERLVRRRYGLRAIRRRLRQSAYGYAELVERIPRDARDLLHTIRRDKMVIRLEHQGLQRLNDEIERASRNISYALVISALLVGGAIMFLADTAAGPGMGILFYLGVAAIVIALGTGLFRLVMASR